MSELDDIISQIPMDQVASALGVDRAEAESATRAALPALLGGLQANASDPAGEASLANAVSQHDPGVFGSSLDAVDTDDGQKIVQNIFGGNTSDVVSALGGTSGVKSSGLIQQLLPILAPIVLSYLAGKLGGGGLGSILGGGSGGAGSPPVSKAGTATGDTDVFGTGVLPDAAGGAANDAPTSAAGGSAGTGAAGGGLGDILGSILGGVSGAGGSGGSGSGGSGGSGSGGTSGGSGGLEDLIGGVLGGLLGGGKR